MKTGSTQLLYHISGLPLFQNKVYQTRADARHCPLGEVKLVEDLHSGLVYNAAFNPASMEYDTDYNNESPSSQFKKHLEDVAAIILRRLGFHSLVEVGCGKGAFLEMLLARGCDVTGFDPAYEGDNPRVQKRCFDSSLEIRNKGIILRHVLEHIQNPVSFLEQIRMANGGSGLIYIEVPCFEWICRQRSWFDVYYEHVNYLRLSDFFRMFSTVLESGYLFGEQHLYVVAELESLRIPQMDSKDRVNFPSDFLSSYMTAERPNARMAVWGGASKGVIFALLKSRNGQPIDMVIDINVAKQGKYLPVTGLQVFSPEEGLANLPKDSTIYVMNLNYLKEIRIMSDNKYHYQQLQS
tara:strand:+ start:339 stop:1394 length:1056 start_codon:yes stop_codon:yes gene_type:complete